jgi:hypothetical protein
MQRQRNTQLSYRVTCTDIKGLFVGKLKSPYTSVVGKYIKAWVYT